MPSGRPVTPAGLAGLAARLRLGGVAGGDTGRAYGERAAGAAARTDGPGSASTSTPTGVYPPGGHGAGLRRTEAASRHAKPFGGCLEECTAEECAVQEDGQRLVHHGHPRERLRAPVGSRQRATGVGRRRTRGARRTGSWTRCTAPATSQAGMEGPPRAGRRRPRPRVRPRAGAPPERLPPGRRPRRPPPPLPRAIQRDQHSTSAHPGLRTSARPAPTRRHGQ